MPANPNDLLLQHGDTVVLIGDSITDCGRRQDERRHLGGGYVANIADYLAACYPDRQINLVNVGISGNRVVDLEGRWDEDVIAHKPDWVSVSIGINDVWRKFDGRPDLHISPEDYAPRYRGLLEKTKRAGAKLILMETSVIGEEIDNESNRLLRAYNEVIRGYAKEFDAVLVPIFDAFETAITQRPGFAWTGDGVHPFPSGHMLMATTWLRAVGAKL
ncbi:MAG: SGNH/GDSL hydrolase family protein [Candidatus Poribacteria bacterium]|nr:SGNH/GDSL hydrolase family protein [Candidatus Poribacteria bacterium]